MVRRLKEEGRRGSGCERSRKSERSEWAGSIKQQQRTRTAGNEPSEPRQEVGDREKRRRQPKTSDSIQRQHDEAQQG